MTIEPFLRHKYKTITPFSINYYHPLNKPLIETIRLENGILHNLPYHQARLDRSRRQLFLTSEALSLANSIVIPSEMQRGLYKCRVIYDTLLRSISFEPYRVRPLRSLLLLADNSIEYAHKWKDRSRLMHLYRQRGQADDVLIVKNGRLTDTTYANIALYDGHQWYTPAEPLLKGTRRAALLDAGELELADISLRDLKVFRKIRLINAMLPTFDWEQQVTVSVRGAVLGQV